VDMVRIRGSKTHWEKIKKHFGFGTGFLTRLAREREGAELDLGQVQKTPVFGTQTTDLITFSVSGRRTRIRTLKGTVFCSDAWISS